MITKLKKRLVAYKRNLAINKISESRSIQSDFNKNTLCIFSSPRGGSTWLTELLFEAEDFIAINEPFFQGRFRTDKTMPKFEDGRPYLKKLNYWYHHHISTTNHKEEDLDIFKRLYSGKLLSSKLAPYNSESELKNFNNILVKFCYGNLMLPWIVKEFNTNAILLARHPCAVIASQLKVKGAFRHIEANPTFLFPDHLEQSPFADYSPILKKIKRPEENLAALWAITVGKTMQHPDTNKKWLKVKYENLIRNPKVELDRIFEFASDFNWKQEKINFEKPSRSTEDTNLSKHIQNGTQLTKWKTTLTSAQIANINAILKEFEVANYEEL